jgi:TolB-like protein
MVEQSTKSVRIDLNQFKLQLYLKPEVELTLHFDTPSRQFYLSVIGLVIHEMKKRGRITSIPLQNQLETLALLNKTVGASAGSSKKEHLLPRIYRKWKDALPDLENAPLFKVVGRKKRYDELMEKVYEFGEGEKDDWANLFEYVGSHENVRLRFSIDRLNAGLDDVVIVYGENPKLVNADAWQEFITGLKEQHLDKSQTDSVYRKITEPGSVSLPSHRTSKAKPNSWPWLTICSLIGLAVGVAAYGVWRYNSVAPRTEVAYVQKKAFPLPDKQSIAVLPFQNLSDDPRQDYFCSGLTEEIITGLTKIPSLLVIARNSTFQYKRKETNIRQVSEELGVRYVLSGNVRKVENRVRITTHLTDALMGNYLWAERYDREFKDIFAIQDEITIKTLAALKVQLAEGEKERALEKYTNNPQAYLKILEGTGYLYDFKTAKALKSFEEARALDPQCAATYAWIAWVQVLNAWFGPSSSQEQSLEKAFESAEKCASLDDELAACAQILGYVYILKRNYDKAISQAKRTVELYPNSAQAAELLVWALRSAGRYEEALKEQERALRLDPIKPAFSLPHLWRNILSWNEMRSPWGDESK